MLCENLTNNQVPVSILDFVKNYLRIEGTADDIYLTSLIGGVIENLVDKTNFSPINNDYTCAYTFDVLNSSLMSNGLGNSWVKLPIIYPFIALLEIKINDETYDLDYKVCDYYLMLDIRKVTCSSFLCVKLKYNAGVLLSENIPNDILLLIAMTTAGIYDDCVANNNHFVNNIFNKYDKKRFL